MDMIEADFPHPPPWRAQSYTVHVSSGVDMQGWTVVTDTDDLSEQYDVLEDLPKSVCLLLAAAPEMQFALVVALRELEAELARGGLCRVSHTAIEIVRAALVKSGYTP